MDPGLRGPGTGSHRRPDARAACHRRPPAHPRRDAVLHRAAGASRATGQLAAMTQFDPTDPARFEQMYRDDRLSHGLPTATPWDIGGPQPVVQQLVAVGAVKGEVLDPGTGPGHHAIYYASAGYSATGIDGSAGALERARENAQKAGVSVNFELGDATKLDGLENRFDTVVDCA